MSVKFNKKLLEQFGRDEALEKEGVWIDFQIFKIKAARAGGSNTKFSSALTKRLQQFRGRIHFDSLPLDQQREIMMEIYASTVVLDWQGVTGDDGKPVPCTKENVVDFFKALPEVYEVFVLEVDKFGNFKMQVDEAVKNS